MPFAPVAPAAFGPGAEAATGTWVDVGRLRLALASALRPLARDAVVRGEGRAELRALAWPDEGGFRDLFGEGFAEVAARRRPELDRVVAARLRALGAGRGSSRRVAALRWLAEPPSPVAGEIDDKAHVNQRRCLATRASEVERLYAEGTDSACLRS